MLSVKENAVMKAIYTAAKNRGALLIAPIDLMKNVKTKNLTLKETENIVNALYRDGYYDLIYSQRAGQEVYCITLTEKGKGFEREGYVFKRNLLFRLGLSVGFAVLSFLVGLILKAIF